MLPVHFGCKFTGKLLEQGRLHEPLLEAIEDSELELVTADAVEAKLADTPEAEPLLHPALASIYRKAVSELETLVHDPATCGEAVGLMRGLIDAVILTPVDSRLEIELRGELAAILALSEAGKSKAFSPKEKALQIKMVAGARSHLYRTRIHYERCARK